MGRSSAYGAALCAILLAAIGAAWAQEGRAQTDCTWETAERLSVRRIDGAETGLRGRCVRVRAELDGWQLSAARPQRRSVAAPIDFIGAYSRDATLLEPFRERSRRVEVLGVVGHCSDICAGEHGRDEQGSTTICMPTGFCHYYDDPYVMIEAVR
ncbi:MAG: hypothetical protein ACT4OF_10520 [Caulobacteraceae bacterium]